MKNFLITQNLIKNKTLQFSLEKNWFDYATKLNINLFPLGYKTFNKKLIASIKFEGVIFSGGNDLFKISRKKENYLRDNFEVKLLKYALANNKKIIGICRGFQFIANYFNNQIIKIDNHVKKKHKVNILNSTLINSKYLYTNSYHNYGFKSLNKNFEVIAISNDENIEIAINKKNKILCFMFHPERRNFSQYKIDKLLKNFI